MESYGVSEQKTKGRGVVQTRQQNWKFYNVCSKALAICEATTRFPDTERETRRFSGLAGETANQRYERIRVYSANNAFSKTEDTREHSSFRDNYISERGLSQESNGILSEEERTKSHKADSEEFITKLRNSKEINRRPSENSRGNQGYDTRRTRQVLCEEIRITSGVRSVVTTLKEIDETKQLVTVALYIKKELTTSNKAE